MQLEMEGRQGGCVAAYTPFGIRVWLANQGQAAAGPFVVELNGEKQIPVDALAAGESLQVHFPGTVPDGAYRVWLDPSGQVHESDENNNTRSYQAPTPTPPPICTPTPSTPGSASAKGIPTGAALPAPAGFNGMVKPWAAASMTVSLTWRRMACPPPAWRGRMALPGQRYGCRHPYLDPG